jgi:hypothetical protein
MGTLHIQGCLCSFFFSPLFAFEDMDLLDLITKCSMVVTFLVLLISYLTLQPRSNYHAIGTFIIQPSAELVQKLQKLKHFTLTLTIISIILSTTEAVIYPTIFAFFRMILLTLFTFAFTYRYNFAENAATGGHVSAFLVLAFILVSEIEKIKHINALYLTQVITQSVVLIVLGLFTTREEAESEDQSRETGASIFSLMTMDWLGELLYLGNKRPLVPLDIWDLYDDDRSKVIAQQWDLIKTGKTIRDIIMLNKGYFLLQYLFAFMVSILSFTGPFFMFQIITAIQIGKSKYELLTFIVGLLVCSVLQALGESNTMSTGARASTRARTVLIDQIYQKTLRRIVGKEGLGNVVGLMSVDADQTRRMCIQGFMIFLRLPLTLIIAVVSLFAVLGLSAFVGVFLILFFIPITGMLGKKIMRYKKKILKNMDQRVGTINEMLHGIRIIKYFAWEEYFTVKIEKIRKSELQAVVKWWMIRLVFKVIGGASGVLISLITLAVYSLWFGKTLDAAVAFTSMSLLMTISDLLGQVYNINIGSISIHDDF